jgi:hypothetical protein
VTKPYASLRLGVLLGLCFGCAVHSAEAASLDIKLHAIKNTLLIGEPVVIVLDIHSQARLDLEDELTYASAPLKLLIDRGEGFAPYVERSWIDGERDSNKRVLPGGHDILEYVLSIDDATGDWVFPRPGAYALVVEYDDADTGIVRSNVIRVDVKPPEGSERVVFEVLRSLSPEDKGVHDSAPLAILSTLAAEHASSAYLQAARLAHLRFQEKRIIDGYDPDDQLPDVDPPIQPNTRPETKQAWLLRLLPQGDSLRATAGQFEPDAMVEVAGLYDSVGEHDRALQLYRDVIARFADRNAAKKARARLDVTPPAIAVVATPRSLWPPNNKLVGVNIVVTTSDNVDPSPAVALVSILCDDACDSSHDIVGATLDSDDRSFQLRATRSGGMTGRTYTITYVAKDAAGNSRTTQTTVIVPHDQGK